MGTTVTANEGRELAVGFGVLLLLLVAVFQAQRQESQPSGFTVSADFSSVSGVEVGSEVQLGGVKIGEVTAMRLGESLRAELAMTVNSSFPEDSSASIQSESLFGDKIVLIEPGGSPESVGNGSHLILTEDSLLLDDLLAMVIHSAQSKQEQGQRKRE